MTRSDVVQRFLSHRKAWQVRGGAMTDGDRLYWHGILVAEWIDRALVFYDLTFNERSEETDSLRSLTRTLLEYSRK